MKHFITSNAAISDNKSSFGLIFFCTGGLIHQKQSVDGITICPIESKLDYKDLNDSINGFLSENLETELPYNDRYASEYRAANPLFAIIFHAVTAIDKDDAYYFCYEKTMNIFSIIGFKNEFRPSIVALFHIEEGATKYAYHFQISGYKGNLVQDFNPNKLADAISKYLPVIENKPLSKMLLEDYSFSMNESNLDFRYFRLWAILEFIAKRIIHDNNITLLDANKNVCKYNDGNIAKTKGALGKVYQMIYDGDYNKYTYSNSTTGTVYSITFEMTNPEKEIKDKISLWDSIQCLYSIRNAVAHQGRIIIEDLLRGKKSDSMAGKYLQKDRGSFIGFIEYLVKQTIDKCIIKL